MKISTPETLKLSKFLFHFLAIFLVVRAINPVFKAKKWQFLADKNGGNGAQNGKIWNASRFCVSSLRRGHANLLCIVPILVYVLPKQVHWTLGEAEIKSHVALT